MHQQVGAGLTFKIFEWQAVLAARILAGRATLPPLEEQQKWEADRVTKKGDKPAFTTIFPDFEEYFEAVRRMAGPGGETSRQLPPYDREWFNLFMSGHERRKAMWERQNKQASGEARL